MDRKDPGYKKAEMVPGHSYLEVVNLVLDYVS